MPQNRQHAHIGFPPPQIFDLVADVESYPEFLPWVLTARIQRRKDHTIWVEMTMGSGLLRRRFATVAQLDRPHRIVISGHDPMFRRFEQRWNFAQSANSGTDIEYLVDYEFRSRVLQMVVGSMVVSQAENIVAAFKTRAQKLYGAVHAGHRMPYHA